jgi:hypothetical protein
MKQRIKQLDIDERGLPPNYKTIHKIIDLLLSNRKSESIGLMLRLSQLCALLYILVHASGGFLLGLACLL